jgi:hypothetical protein
VSTKQDTWRGHEIVEIGDVWVYADTREPVADNPERPCGLCRLPNRDDGHDACLGEIPGLMNACCGHGEAALAYAQLLDRSVVAGAELTRRFVQFAGMSIDKPGASE